MIQTDFLNALFPGDPGDDEKKKRRKTNLRRYAGLREIPEDEWDDFFPNTGEPWTQEDIEYLLRWWGHDDIVSLSYALGRPPWNLQRVISELRKQGVEIPYLRGVRKDVDVSSSDSGASNSLRNHRRVK